MTTKVLEEIVEEIDEFNRELGKAITQRAINTLLDLERCNYALKPGEYDKKLKELEILRNEFKSRERFYKPGEENAKKFDEGILRQLNKAYVRLASKVNYIR